MELNTTQALIDGAQIAVLGMTVVFSALVLIAVILANFDNLEKVIKIKPYEHGHGHGHSAAPKKQVKKSAPTDAVEEVEEGIPPQVIVAISAAIAVATEKKIRITRVRYRREPAQPTWAAQGRTAIMSGPGR